MYVDAPVKIYKLGVSKVYAGLEWSDQLRGIQMLRSMTAFARQEKSTNDGDLVCEIRSVNHRYLEASLRLPEEFRALEAGLRERLQKRLGRGKIECHLRFRPSASKATELLVNEDYTKALLKACTEVEDWMHNPARLSVMEVMRWPGVIMEDETDMGPLHKEALSLVEATIDDLVVSRTSEGERTQSMLEQRCEAISEIVAQVRVLRPQLMTALRDKMKQRIDELDIEADPQRLEQELAMIAQKLDVDEELDRLDSHLEEMKSVFKRKEPVGRRLDFLMQEFNREANTLGSKSHDSETTRLAVELKVLIEQMREQVQNIE